MASKLTFENKQEVAGEGGSSVPCRGNAVGKRPESERQQTWEKLKFTGAELSV